MACILSRAPIFCRVSFHKNIIFGSVTQIKRVYSFEHLTNKTNPFVEKKFRLKDNISDDYKLVYREQNYVNIITTTAHIVGWVGAIFGVVLLGYLIYENPPEREGLEFEEGGIIKPLSNLSKRLALLGCSSVCVTLILCSQIIPFRIYYSATEKLYKAIFVPSILGKKQLITFGEYTVAPIFKRDRLGDIFFKINGRIVLLDKECFPVPFVRERMIHKTIDKSKSI